mmetsp:Transcript_23423/g.34714  ORF Transcript_23423/g.34714 Transcript_23423/m.34714 type:complete len:166 (-) Transcript_23423:16-513(-)
MCMAIAINSDKRTNPLLLQAQYKIAGNVNENGGTSNEHVSQEDDITNRLLSNIVANDPQTQEFQDQCKTSFENLRGTKSMIVQFVALGALLILSIVTQMRSNQVQIETSRLRGEMKHTRIEFERRKAKMKRLQDNNNSEAFMHILNTYDVPLESDLAGEILMAYE